MGVGVGQSSESGDEAGNQVGPKSNTREVGKGFKSSFLYPGGFPDTSHLFGEHAFKGSYGGILCSCFSLSRRRCAFVRRPFGSAHRVWTLGASQRRLESFDVRTERPFFLQGVVSSFVICHGGVRLQ